MNNAEKIMGELTDVVRDLSQANRKAHLSRLKVIAQLLGLDPEDYNYFARNVAEWPDRLFRDSTEIKYLVDFGYADPPDHRLYGATFEEVCKLLRYTPGSCRVAFSTKPDKRVDRSQRGTKLGKCMITRLPDVVNPDDYPQMRRLKDREVDLFPPKSAVVDGKVVRAPVKKY